MAALSGEKTLAELSVEFGVHPTMISNWKQELVKRAGELFARGSKAPAADAKARAVGGQAEAEHQQAASRAQGLPVPSARQDDRPAKPKPALAKAGVWAADITYIAMQQGFLYLVAIQKRNLAEFFDWYNLRRPHQALGWR